MNKKIIFKNRYTEETVRKLPDPIRIEKQIIHGQTVDVKIYAMVQFNRPKILEDSDPLIGLTKCSGI